MPKPKKKTTRSKTKHPALKKKYNSRVKQETIDFDYLHLLNEEEKDFLNKFMEEEMNGRFKNDGTDFSQTKEQRKLIYDRTNARQRCLYGITRNAKYTDNKLANYDDVITTVEEQSVPASVEDAYIDFIEYKQIEEFLKEYDSAMLLFKESHE